VTPGDEVEQCKLGRVKGVGHEARSVRSCPLPGSLWRAYWLMDFADTLPEAVREGVLNRGVLAPRIRLSRFSPNTQSRVNVFFKFRVNV
jgi:hypothetical protein